MIWLLRFSPMLGIFDWLFGGDDAAKAKTAYAFLSKNQDVLSYRNLLGWLWDNLAWWFIKLMYSMAEWARKLVNQVFGIGDLLKDTGLNEMYLSLIKGVGISLLVISLVWVAIRMVTTNRGPQVSSVIVQTIVAVLLLGWGGPLINSLAQVSQNAFQDVAGTNTDDSLPMDIISRNTLDLFKVSQEGFGAADKSDWRKLNSFNKIGNSKTKVSYHDLFMQTDMTYVLTPEGVDKIAENAKNDKISDQLNNLKYVIGTDEEGQQTAVPVPTDGLIPFINTYKPGYARFTAHRGIITMSLIGIAIAYIFSAFTIAGAFIDLLFQRLYGVLVVATDLDSGQRTKQVVNDIFNSLLLIWFTGIEIRIYELILTAMGNLKLWGPVQVILVLAATFGLFKGSQAAGRYFGIDTGLKRGAGSLLAAVGMAGVVKKAGSAVGSAVGSSLNMIRGRGKKDDAATEGAGDEGSRIPGSQLPKPTGMERLRDTAGKVGGALGYAQAAGAGGLAKDVGHKVADTATQAKDAVVDKANAAVESVANVGRSFSASHDAGKQKAEDRYGSKAPETSAPTPSNNGSEAPQAPTETAVNDQAKRLTDERPSTAADQPAAPIPTTAQTTTPSADQGTTPAAEQDKPATPAAPAAGQTPAATDPAAPKPAPESAKTPSAGTSDTPSAPTTDPAAPQAPATTPAPAQTDAPLGDMGGTTGNASVKAPKSDETIRMTADKQRTISVEGNTQTQVHKTGSSDAPVNLGDVNGSTGSATVTGGAGTTTSDQTVKGPSHIRRVSVDQGTDTTQVTTTGPISAKSVNSDLDTTTGIPGGGNDNG